MCRNNTYIYIYMVAPPALTYLSSLRRSSSFSFSLRS